MKQRNILLALIDSGCFAIPYIAFSILASLSETAVNIKPLDFLVNGLIFFFSIMISRLIFRVYSSIWRYGNARAYVKIVAADFIAGMAALGITYLLDYCYIGVWQSLSVVAIPTLITLTSRFVYQILHTMRNRTECLNSKINVVIVGAGQVGVLLADELIMNKKSHYNPYCFVDNDPQKIGKDISGLRVYSESDDIIAKIKRFPVQEVFLAMPNLDNERLQSLHDFYSKTGCKVKIYDFPLADDGDLQTDKGRRRLRELSIEDLLFRHPLSFVDDNLKQFYSNKIVLVTGGGGSIGSELCRQVAKLGPKKLIILDIYENNAYDIQQELVRTYGASLDLNVEIASVRDRERLDFIFGKYHPDVVFHAAAHKHVPLMENNGGEAIKNNILGTFNTADMAEKHGVGKFIMISTDKAVNPTNIMGASKRMCEMIIQSRTDSKTSFSAVRFGNVLGSNGSVIPLFKKQIEDGGPVTITDKRIIRYFMTIPEASQLVMQAGAMAKSGELFVLDMGKPVKIVDLAENMIRLSGYTPYEDIDIVEIGLRPGEKLYEELLIKTETLNSTDNKMIFIEKDKPLSRAEVDVKISELKAALEKCHGNMASPIVKRAVKAAVPTYRDPEEVNKNAEKSEEMQAVETEEQSNATTETTTQE